MCVHPPPKKKVDQVAGKASASRSVQKRLKIQFGESRGHQVANLHTLAYRERMQIPAVKLPQVVSGFAATAAAFSPHSLTHPPKAFPGRDPTDHPQEAAPVPEAARWCGGKKTTTTAGAQNRRPAAKTLSVAPSDWLLSLRADVGTNRPRYWPASRARAREGEPRPGGDWWRMTEGGVCGRVGEKDPIGHKGGRANGASLPTLGRSSP